MKKYPFSKKAVSAMLAATVAFTPVLTTGTLIQPTSAIAATTTSVDADIDQLAAKFFPFYMNVGKYNFSGTPTGAISLLNFAKINNIATANQITLSIDPSKQSSFATLMQNTATLIYTKYASQAELSAAVKKYRTDNATSFNTVFENNGDIVVEQLIKFTKDLEGEMFDAIETALKGPNPSSDAVLRIAVDNVFKKGNYSELKNKLSSNLGIGVVELFELVNKINNEVVDVNHGLRSAMIQSAFEEKGAKIVADGNEFQLQIAVGPFIGALTTQLKWETNNPSIADFDKNKLIVKNSGTVDVYAKFDGLTLMTKKGVQVTASGGGGGGVIIPVPPGPGTGTGTNPHLPGATVPTPGTTPSGQPTVVTTVPKDKVSDVANQITSSNNTVHINLEVPKAGELVMADLPASLFTEAAKRNQNAVVEIRTQEAAYKLPSSEVNVAQLAQTLGVSAEDVNIIISVNVVESPKVENGVQVISKTIEFTVEAVSGSKREPITTFTSYVERSIKGDKAFDSNNNVGVRIKDDGTLESVPTLFNGTEATFKSLTNSKYSIISNHKTFKDVDNNKNWAEKYIETLASKLIINGKSEDTYAPGEEMTRAQFTVLLVKALGLPGGKYEQKFKDVKESDWFNANGELAAALKYGIITGMPDGRFAPNEKVTRQQAAAMLHRAMQLPFLKYDTKKLDKTKKVTDFKDASKMQEWAKPSIEAIYQAGIMNGKGDSTFDPSGKTKRDQMAKMLAEFLISANLMNQIK
ncbi:S-layer homology domain-containing protein [Pseudoneobacillus sp. C159]